MGEPRIILLVPLYRMLDSSAAVALIQLISEVTNSGKLASMLIPVDMFLTSARNRMALAAIDAYKKGIATHALWVDQDISVPAGAVDRMLSYDLPIVSGLYYCRDFKPCVFNPDTQEKWQSAPHSGLVKADGTGFGCLLMRIEVLIHMANHFGDCAWFQMPQQDECHVGEDVFFFRRAKEMGIPVYLDCDIQCPHSIVLGLTQPLVELVQNTEGYTVQDNRR